MNTKLRSIIVPAIIFFLGTLSLQAQNTGILIMAHGGGTEWNELVKQAAQPLKKEYPVAFAWGMANPVTLQKGVDQLEQQGVKHIIAVPLFISSHSPIIRQTEYLLGLRDSLADRPMPLMHGSKEYVKMTGAKVDSSDYMHGMLVPPNLQPLNVSASVTMTNALDDHDVVANILLDRIHELSSKPGRETVILVAHGPNQESDNRQWIAAMESLIKKIQLKQTQENHPAYKQLFALTVRDDAPKPIFNQAKAQFRALVRQAGQNSDVIVVPLFLSSGGREQAVAERLKGLNFKWSGHTLLPDKKISRFLVESVQHAVKRGQNTTTMR